MHTLTTTDLVAALNWRYATKAFDPARKLPAATLDALLEALVLAPSSFGFQPWKFLVVESPALRARLRAESWDQPQVTDASHLIVVTVRETLTEAHMDEHLARTMAVRGVTAEALAPLRGMMLGFISRMSPEQQFVWNSRQAYIALGQLMTSAAVMGVDTCPLEGISTAAYDDILDLAGSGYRTVCACALGYRATDDKYAALPKVRFPREQIVQVVTAG
jgi:nitroreductase